jgi:RHS repeat-associated protein
MQTSTQATTQLLNLLTLLQTKQTLENIKTYQDFCYTLYLLASYSPKVIPTNTVEQSTRAYTGHEQIAELSGLIHSERLRNDNDLSFLVSNARVYDSDIGRFLSADTIIQDPHDSQAYNRYSYVRNNPLKYTKAIVGISLGVVYIVYFS